MFHNREGTLVFYFLEIHSFFPVDLDLNDKSKNSKPLPFYCTLKKKKTFRKKNILCSNVVEL